MEVRASESCPLRSVPPYLEWPPQEALTSLRQVAEASKYPPAYYESTTVIRLSTTTA